MKNSLRPLACALALCLPLAPSPAFAADPPDAATLQKLRERIRADHKGLVAENLPLTEAEAKVFWPVFDKCHEELDAAQRKANRALLDFVNSENSMTDANAKRIAGDLLAAEAAETKARKACFDRTAKVLPGKKAARFLQIESKIRALGRYDTAIVIPLVQ